MGAMTLLASTTLSSDTQTVTISSIPTTKTHMIVQAHLRSTSTDYGNITIGINGAYTASYQIRDMYISASSGGVMKQVYDNFGSNTFLYLGSLTGNNSSSDRYSTVTMFIPRYSSTSILKNITGWGPIDPAGGNQNHEWCYGAYNSTSAVTSLSFRHYNYGSVNIGSGSKIWVYGV